MIVSMAWRNLLRHRRRTLITSVAIAVGFVFFIVLDSLMVGWANDTELAYRRYEVASGRVVSERWWNERRELPLSSSFFGEKIERIIEDTGMEHAARVEFFADLVMYRDPYPEDGVFPTRVIAVDPIEDAAIFELTSAFDSPYSTGRFLGENTDEVVVGSELARRLMIEVGYPLRLQFRGHLGYEEIMDATVVGIMRSDSPLVNAGGVYISRLSADYYLELEGRVTWVGFQSAHGSAGRRQIAALRDRLPDGYRVVGYQEIAGDFLAMIDSERGFVDFAVFLIFVIAVVGISNTMMMSVFERRREIGVLRACGMRDRDLYLMYMIEAGLIGTIATVVGGAVGALINVPLVDVGLPIARLIGNAAGQEIDLSDFAMGPYMRGAWSRASFFWGAVFAIGVSGCVSLLPVRRVLKMGIPDNLGG